MIRPDPEYVAARTALLGALEGIQEHREAVVVVGAQAVYIRTDLLEGYQDHTTDGDLAVDPELLADRPGLETAMRQAGFKLKDEESGHPEPEIWIAKVEAAGGSRTYDIPVDLIVPEAVAPPGGRRGARLGGEHGKRATRRAVGLEGAIVDFSVEEIRALQEGDSRKVFVKVAGSAALIVAKVHKVEDRSERPDRLNDKDAADVVRLFLASNPFEVADRFALLLEDSRSADVTRFAIDRLRPLFGTPRGLGLEMASRALAGVLDTETVSVICTGFVDGLVQALNDSGRS